MDRGLLGLWLTLWLLSLVCFMLGMAAAFLRDTLFYGPLP